MQISLEKPSSLERRLTVELPEDRIADQVKSRLDDLCKKVKIDGFRNGRAPLSVVKQRFGRRVRDEVVGELLQSSFADAMSQEALRPAGQPTIDTVSSDPGAGLKFTASFEVFPEIELAPLEELKLEKAVCEVVDADIDLMIDKLRQQNREWIEVERASTQGDQVQIDFTGSIEGAEFPGGSGEDFPLELGTGSMIEGFEDGLLDQSAGAQVTLDLQFPDEYRNETLAGKPVQFAVTVKKVSQPKLPELDPQFFERFGVKEGGMDAFRAEIRKNMEKERDRATKQRFNQQVMSRLVEANAFDVPQALVSGEMDGLRRQMQQELLMRGLDPAKAAGDLESAVRARAEERVRLGLLMAEVVKASEIKADPGKVRQMIEEAAASYEDPAAVVNWHYENPDQLRQVEALCLEDEAVAWLAERAQVTEVTTTFDGLMNPMQTEENGEAES